MKKLKLKMLAFNVTDLLSREQLKNVLGGDNGSNNGDIHECLNNTFGCTFNMEGTGKITGQCVSSFPEVFQECMCTDGQVFGLSTDCIRS